MEIHAPRQKGGTVSTVDAVVIALMAVQIIIALLR